MVRGRLEEQKWQDREGNERTNIQLVCDEVEFQGKAESKPSGGYGGQSNNDFDDDLNSDIPF